MGNMYVPKPKCRDADYIDSLIATPKAFFVSRDGDIEYWATNDLAMDELTRLAHAEQCWGIENYHRGLKQCCGVERAQVRAARAQRNHIGLAIRAFLRLEQHFYTTGVSWYEAKARIIRGAVRAYIANPVYNLS